MKPLIHPNCLRNMAHWNYCSLTSKQIHNQKNQKVSRLLRKQLSWSRLPLKEEIFLKTRRFTSSKWNVTKGDVCTLHQPFGLAIRFKSWSVLPKHTFVPEWPHIFHNLCNSSNHQQMTQTNITWQLNGFHKTSWLGSWRWITSSRVHDILKYKFQHALHGLEFSNFNQ